MKKDYFRNMSKTMIDANEYAFRYGDGKAWDNRKKKTMKRYLPRGKVYNRLENLEWKAMYLNSKDLLEEIKVLVASGNTEWKSYLDGCY